MSLLQMSFSGAVLICAIVVVRAVAIHKLPKNTFLVLWSIVLLRLLVPFSIPSMFSVYSIVNRCIDVTTFEGTQISNIIPIMPEEQWEPMKEKIAVYLSSVSIWFVVWCTGMILCITFFIVTYLYWYLQFQTSPSVHNSYIEQWLTAHKLNRPFCIRQSEKITTPLTYGVFRPVIVMPKNSEWENIRQIQYILLHEYVHICRFDTVIKQISALALCIHWFNPLVWAMYILLNRDIELSCDESVVRKLGESGKSAYAKMLIGMEAKKSGLMPFCNSFNKNAIEERIEAIMRMKKITLLSLGVAAIIVISIAATFATSAVGNRQGHPDSYIDIYNYIDTVYAKDADRDKIYTIFIEMTMTSQLKDHDGIEDCRIHVSYSNGEFIDANVYVVTENDETNALKTEILDYVSRFLGISMENVSIVFS